jgi:transposase InsO family protein
MIRDRDRIYGGIVTRRLRAMGIRDKPIAPASPWQNGFAERLIGSIRRECLDHIMVFGEAHLLRVLRSYARYHNNVRAHRSLDKDAPVSRPVQRTGSITSFPSWADSITATPELRFFGTHRTALSSLAADGRCHMLARNLLAGAEPVAR